MKRALLGLLAAVLALLGSTALGLGIIHITDFPYTVDIDRLNIEESSGLDREEIMANYSFVMDYLSPFTDNEFDLPTLAYTQTGAGHFADCKVIFGWFYLLGALSVLAYALLAAFKVFDKRVLRYGGIITIAIPVVFGLGAAVNFDRMFVVFHAIFFDGDTWIFDPVEDAIINILPQDFFMHCAVFIAVFWALAAALQIAFSIVKRNGEAHDGPVNGLEGV